MTFLEKQWGPLLDEIDDVGREFLYVFFASSPVTENDWCLVVDEQEFGHDEDVPEIARRRGFNASLNVSDLQQVVGNLSAQRPSADRTSLMRAISYYYVHDAFIDLATQ